MDESKLRARLTEIRGIFREMQLAMFALRKAAVWHISTAQAVINNRGDARKAIRVNDLDGYLAELPNTLSQMQQLKIDADLLWLNSRSRTPALTQFCAALIPLFDSVSINPTRYENVAGMADKPLVEEAHAALLLKKDDPDRMKLESSLWMDVADYLENEAAIVSKLAEINAKRDETALLLQESTNKQLHERGITDARSLAIGHRGAREALNYFDERAGYRFENYAIWWIKREFLRAGIVF